jgi:ATP-dependent phosphoenolpyruvate carboxykinase
LTAKIFIKPHFEKLKIRLCDLRTLDIESFYNQEKSENKATKTVILQLHEIITIALDYAVELKWIVPYFNTY